MSDGHWFEKQLKSGVGDTPPGTIHVLREDGAIETMSAKAVVVERDDYGLTFSRFGGQVAEAKVSAMVVSISKSGPDASLVVHPGAANLMLVGCRGATGTS